MPLTHGVSSVAGSRSRNPGQHYLSNTPLVSGSVDQLERATVRLAYLPRDDKPDAAAFGFGRIKRNESIARIHEPRSAIDNGQHQFFFSSFPTESDRGLCVARSI